MMLDGYPPIVSLQEFLATCENVFLIIFCVEMCIMIGAYGPCRYLKTPVTCFDGIIVTASVVQVLSSPDGQAPFTALRTLRLFRVLNKLASRWPSFRVLLKAMLYTGKSLSYWIVLFSLVLYICTLMFTQLFQSTFHFVDVDTLAEVSPDQGGAWCGGTEGLDEAFRQDCIPRAHFDTFLWSLVSIFQIMTGENWNTIMYAGMRAQNWAYAAFFVLLIIFGQILFLSLFLSMLLSKFDEVQDEMERREAEKLSKSKEEMTRSSEPRADGRRLSPEGSFLVELFLENETEAKRHIFRTPTREPPMPTAAQRAAMRGGPARDTESVATSRSHAEVAEIPVPKVIPPRAWSPSPSFTPLSQSLRPWSGSLFQPLLVPAASGFGYGVPVPLPLQPESPIFSSHQHFAPRRLGSFSPPPMPQSRHASPVPARRIWPQTAATAQGHWQSPSASRPSRSLSPLRRPLPRPSPASPPEPRTHIAAALPRREKSPRVHESPPRNVEPPLSPAKNAAEAPPPVTRMASTSWLPKRNHPASTVLGREPLPSIERDFDGAGRSPAGPENLPGPSVEALKLELKRRGLDFVFCFSREDLYRRLREEMIEDCAREAAERKLRSMCEDAGD
ncbi:CACNA1H [Symbiodinium sp. CCMP2592]|nr:CACNA1H [Symbiodinium sp. CCMP2592]